MTTDQTTTGTPISSIVEQATATGAWWEEDKLDKPSELVLPTRILHALDNAGINTVEQLKAAGPAKLRAIEHLGKQGFDQIVGFLRALDRQQNGGGSHGVESGKAHLR